MTLDLDFPHRYTVEIDPEFPATGGGQEVLYDFPRASNIGRVCTVLRVSPEGGQPWFGRFWTNYGNGLTGVYSCMNERSLCVIAAGSAYVIPVLDPSGMLPVRLEPVIEAYRIPVSNHVLFVGHLEMEAYHTEGQVWRTQRLSIDGLKVRQLDERNIEVLAYDPSADVWSPLTVDARTGTLVEGKRQGWW